MGADDVGTDVVGVVFRHQTRRHVDADNLGRRGIDIFHQRGKATCQRLVQTRSEESVNHHHVRLQLGWVEFLNHLHKLLQLLHLLKPLLVGSTVRREVSTDVKEKSTHPVVLLCQQTGYGKCVATVIARTGKHHDGRRVRVFLYDGLRNRLGRTLHKIEARNGLVLNSVSV